MPDKDRPASRWSPKKASDPAPATLSLPPVPKPPPKPSDPVVDAKNALSLFWGTAGDLNAAEAAEACRKLSVGELQLIGAWIPMGQGRTASKCDRAREIVRGVLAEKK